MCFDMIAPKEIDEYIGKNNVVIIDLRDEEHYNNGHIAGAINMPYDVFEEKYSALSRYKEYVLYCERGGSSIMAARNLCNMGYNVKNVYGGIKGYRGELEK